MYAKCAYYYNIQLYLNKIIIHTFLNHASRVVFDRMFIIYSHLFEVENVILSLNPHYYEIHKYNKLGVPTIWYRSTKYVLI